MYVWSTVIRKRERSLLIGFSLGSDMSCSGRLRFRFDTSSLEFLRLPAGEKDSPDLQNIISMLEHLLRENRIPWQKTCGQYRSLEAEEGFDWMMHQIYA